MGTTSSQSSMPPLTEAQQHTTDAITRVDTAVGALVPIDRTFYVRCLDRGFVLVPSHSARGTGVAGSQRVVQALRGSDAARDIPVDVLVLQASARAVREVADKAPDKKADARMEVQVHDMDARGPYLPHVCASLLGGNPKTLMRMSIASLRKIMHNVVADGVQDHADTLVQQLRCQQKRRATSHVFPVEHALIQAMRDIGSQAYDTAQRLLDVMWSEGTMFQHSRRASERTARAAQAALAELNVYYAAAQMFQPQAEPKPWRMAAVLYGPRGELARLAELLLHIDASGGRACAAIPVDKVRDTAIRWLEDKAWDEDEARRKRREQALRAKRAQQGVVGRGW